MAELPPSLRVAPPSPFKGRAIDAVPELVRRAGGLLGEEGLGLGEGLVLVSGAES